MATAIAESIEISRRPEDVFAYATDFSHFPEWQGGVVSAHPQDRGPTSVGSRALVTRRVGRRNLARTEEITQLDSPTAWTVCGVGGPLTAIVKCTIEPLDQGRRSRLTIAFDLNARGIGHLFARLARRAVRRQLPKNEQKLKELLERPTARPIA